MPVLAQFAAPASLLSLSHSTHRIPQMKNRQIHCDDQRSDDNPGYHQHQRLQQRGQAIRLLLRQLAMVTSMVSSAPDASPVCTS